MPAFNEAASIAASIADVRTHAGSCDIVVVDDGSTDATSAVALAAGAVVLALPYNLGVGGAMRTGFLYAWRHGYDKVVQVDADGQHDARDVDLLLAAVDDADICIGSRFAAGGNYVVRGPRRWAIWLLNRTLSALAHRPLTDVTSGFRAANRAGIEQYLRFYPLDYLGDTIDSLVAAIRAGLTVTEVPVRMRVRQGGRASHGSVASAVYLGRAGAALLVALTRSRRSSQVI